MRKCFMFLSVLCLAAFISGCAQYRVTLYSGSDMHQMGQWTTSNDHWRGIFPTGIIFRDNTGIFGVMRGGLMGHGGGIDETITTEEQQVIRMIGDGLVIYEQIMTTGGSTEGQ